MDHNNETEVENCRLKKELRMWKKKFQRIYLHVKKFKKTSRNECRDIAEKLKKINSEFNTRQREKFEEIIDINKKNSDENISHLNEYYRGVIAKLNEQIYYSNEQIEIFKTVRNSNREVLLAYKTKFDAIWSIMNNLPVPPETNDPKVAEMLQDFVPREEAEQYEKQIHDLEAQVQSLQNELCMKVRNAETSMQQIICLKDLYTQSEQNKKIVEAEMYKMQSHIDSTKARHQSQFAKYEKLITKKDRDLEFYKRELKKLHDHMGSTNFQNSAAFVRDKRQYNNFNTWRSAPAVATVTSADVAEGASAYISKPIAFCTPGSSKDVYIGVHTPVVQNEFPEEMLEETPVEEIEMEGFRASATLLKNKPIITRSRTRVQQTENTPNINFEEDDDDSSSVATSTSSATKWKRTRGRPRKACRN